jgi:hypothetical protein
MALFKLHPRESRMKHELKTIARKLLGQKPSNLNPDKKQLIDFARERLNMTSFADLGGVWNVDGGYSFYAMERPAIKTGVLVDTDFTPAVLARQKKNPGLKIIHGNFGDASVRERIGKVDAVFFFDTLLHQVSPNWDEVLEMYAGIARIFLILNQQFVNLRTTTRLLDLGLDEYARNIPHPIDQEPYKTYFRDLNAIHPQHQRPYRDIHNIWQWGITDNDLIARMNSVGFAMQFYKNCGQCGQLRNVENHSFAFSRPEL